MKHAVWVCVVLSWAGCCMAEETIGVPWEEFKTLYRDSVTRELMGTALQRGERPVHTIEEAVYRLSIGRDHAEGTMLVSGKMLSGEPQPIPLCSDEIIIVRVDSLKGCSLVTGGHSRGEVGLLPAVAGDFQVRLTFYAAFKEDETSRLVSFRIPAALKNSLTLEHPGNVRLIQAQGVVDDTGTRHFAPAHTLSVRFEEKREVPLEEETAPSTVLDTVRFFTSFDENGGMLSVLSMSVASGDASHVLLKKIADAQIWSLTVNGRKRKLFRQESRWMIPLAREGSSRVDLVFLRKGPKLGLRGRLETMLPEIGLPARQLQIGLALPGRVELVSLEAPVSSADAEAWKIPKDFVGTGYFFSRSFYEGQGMTMKLDYREPVENEGGGR
ncbi:hypothetical protein ACFL01_03010 [Planctomycetota bacterium]